ncbi:unnamed protein product [Arabis nemorensis]|uniref:Uncharacterized protein n=1 Tax=Arabis nemorensis TaxID=586526 RepID=A0A565AVY4_9BRAS|nr:unnamed protein product [Arabis nemorensis]
MEKKKRNCSTQASSSKPPLNFPNTAEQDNLTKLERLVSNLKHLSFAAGLLALANQAAEEYESLPMNKESKS